MVYPVYSPIQLKTVHIKLMLNTGVDVVFNLGTTTSISPEKLWTEFKRAKNYNKVEKIFVYILEEEYDKPVDLHEWTNPNTQ